MPVVGQFDDECERSEGYGASFKQKCRRSCGATIGMEALGQMTPNEDTYCELDPSAVDEWGIPVLRFHWQAGENEIKMAKDMQATIRAIVEVAGGTYTTEVVTDGPSPYGLYDAGTAIHESGTVRMGDNPKNSVLNKFCQAHDVKSWRSSEYLLEEASDSCQGWL
jgi:choline dehydrogenase-like flavoprotein